MSILVILPYEKSDLLGNLTMNRIRNHLVTNYSQMVKQM